MIWDFHLKSIGMLVSDESRKWTFAGRKRFQRKIYLQTGCQPKVGGKKREHVGVVDVFAHGHAVEQYPLIMSSNFFSDSFAGVIADGDDDLGADQFYMFEGVTSGKFGGAPGEAASVTRCAHPIAKVAKLIHRVNVTQPAAAQKFVRVRIGDGEGVQPAAHPLGAGDGDEILRHILGVIGRRPRHPRAKLWQGFLHSFVQFIFIAKFEGTDGDDAVG